MLKRIYLPKRRNKYGAIKSKCWSGHIHDSKAEQRYCDQLYLLKKNGDILNYEIQVPYQMIVSGKKITKYIVDFLVFMKDGKLEAREVKSKITKTATWNIKRKLFEALYPEIKHVVIE